MADASTLEGGIGHVFRDKALLRAALTHPSYAQEAPDEPNNQRLEFLGDAVLSQFLSERLFRAFPEEREGFLSQARAALANAASLAQLADAVGLPEQVRVAKHEELNGAKQRENLRADALEALIGAVFLDGGPGAVDAFLEKLFGDVRARVEEEAQLHNPKGRLQEWAAKHAEYPKIEYVLVSTAGPAHARRFLAEVRAGEKTLGCGEGSSRRHAEALAAAQALRALEGDAPA